MKVAAQSGKKKATTKGVRSKPPTGELAVDYRDIETIESIALGFRVQMLSLTDGDGNLVAEVDTGSGVGSDAITLSYGEGKKKRIAFIKGSDLLLAWIRTFDPEEADAIAEAVK